MSCRVAADNNHNPILTVLCTPVPSRSSWDGESGQIYVDSVLVWSQTFAAADGLQLCGAGNGGWHEDVHHFEATLDHSGSTVTIRATSTLNSAADDESFAIDNVWIRPRTIGFYDSFSAGADQWVTNDGAPAVDMTMTCGALGGILGGIQYGGTGVYFERTYDLLAMPHDTLRIDLDFIALDTWDGETGQVMLDGAEIWAWSGRTSGGHNECGRGTPELVQHISEEIDHTGRSLR